MESGAKIVNEQTIICTQKKKNIKISYKKYLRD